MFGGDGGIRTLDALLAHTPLAGEHLRPLGHVSVFATHWKVVTRWLKRETTHAETYQTMESERPKERSRRRSLCRPTPRVNASH